MITATTRGRALAARCVTTARAPRVVAGLVATAMLATLVAVAPPAAGLPGTLDPSYGDGGYVDLAASGANSLVTDLATSPSGRSWALVRDITDTGTETVHTLRLVVTSPSGAPVATLDLTSSFNNFPLVRVVADGEGAYVVGPTPVGTKVLRFGGDLQPVASFGIGGQVVLTGSEVPDAVDAFPVAPSDAVVSAGVLTLVVLATVDAGGFAPVVVRLTSTGALDPSFGGDGSAVAPQGPRDVAPFPYSNEGGKLGARLVIDGAGGVVVSAVPGLGRLMPDGTVDGSFGVGGTVELGDLAVRECEVLQNSCPVALGPDGTIFVGTSGPAQSAVVAVGAGGTGTPTTVPVAGGVRDLVVSGPAVGGELVVVRRGSGTTDASPLGLPLPLGSAGAGEVLSSSFLGSAVAPAGGRDVLLGGYRPTGAGYTATQAKVRLDAPPPPPPTGTISPAGGTVTVGAAVTIDYSCANASSCAAAVVPGEVDDPLPAGWVAPAGTTVLTSGTALDTSTAGVRTVILFAVPVGGTTAVEVDRTRFEVQAAAPTGTILPGSGTVAVGAAVTIDFSCTGGTCLGLVVDGEVPDPVPAGWVPTSFVTIVDGALLDTSVPGVKTALVAVAVPGNPAPVYVARARYDVQAGVVTPTGTISPASGSFAFGSTVPVSFSCTGGTCLGLVVDGEVPDPVPAGWVPTTPAVSITDGSPLDTSTAGVRTALVAVAVPGNPAPVYVARARYEVLPPAAPTGTISPPSGPVTKGAPWPVTFSCTGAAMCLAAAVLGEVPSPLPPGWTPPPETSTALSSGDLLDTSTVGVRTVVIAAFNPGDTAPTEVARARYDVVSNGIISGVVRDNTTNDPVANIRVRALRSGNLVREAYTAEDGSYSLGGLGSSPVDLQFADKSVVPARYETAFLPGIATGTSGMVTTLVRVQAAGAIAGTVVDSVTGAPVPGIRVRAFGLTNKVPSGEVVTGADGTYSFGDIREGTQYFLQFADTEDPDRYPITTSAPVSVGTTGIVSVLVRLPQALSISGRAVDALTGAPIAGLRVRALRCTDPGGCPNGTGSFSVATDTTAADGSYTFAALSDGDYLLNFADVSVSPARYGYLALANPVPAGTTGLVTALTPVPVTGSISGTVVDTVTGAPVAGLRVRALQGGALKAQAFTAADGSYILSGLATGSYALQVADLTVPARYPVAVVTTATTGSAGLVHRVLRTAGPGGISGNVFDATSGSPLANVRVEALGGPTATALVGTAVTGPDGAFSLAGLPVGYYLVRHWTPQSPVPLFFPAGPAPGPYQTVSTGYGGLVILRPG